MGEIYRYRSIDSFINHDELEKQSIFFSEVSFLNDPLEGVRHVNWQGDRIAWKGLFKHYCIAYLLCYTYVMEGGDYADLIEYVYISPNNVFDSNDEFRELNSKIVEITDRFLENKAVAATIEIFSKTNISLEKLGLKSILYFLLQILVAQISFLKNEKYIENYRFITESVYIIIQLFDKINENIGSKDISEFLIKRFYLDQQNKILKKIYNRMNYEEEISLLYKLNTNFYNSYVDSIMNSIFERWYTASFVADCNNSSMWSHYASEHKGVCLIFKTEEHEEREFIELEYIDKSSYEETRNIKRRFEFEQIKYSNCNIQINFFETVGRLTFTQIYNWLSDNGENSIYLENILKNEESWRKEYWNKFSELISTKTEDWSDEQESRLHIDTLFRGAKLDVEEMTIKYEFDSLIGIIFGSKIEDNHVVSILNTLKSKCEKHKRKEFMIKQSFLDENNNRVEFISMNNYEKYVLGENIDSILMGKESLISDLLMENNN